MMKLIYKILTAYVLIITYAVAQPEKILNIYLDLDQTNFPNSSRAIEMGIKTAFAEVNNVIQDYKVNFIIKNHRGNSTKSKLNMDEFIKDPSAIYLMAGQHTPPLVEYADYINKNNIVTLVPSATGGQITRPPNTDKNFIFRLSIDDTKTGYKLVDFAVEELQCKAPHLLLEKSTLGELNYQTLSNSIKRKLGITSDVAWFDNNTDDLESKIIIRNIINKNNDCIIIVSTPSAGTNLVDAINEIDNKIPIVSHWGVNPTNINQAEFYSIQTCFSFRGDNTKRYTQHVISEAKKLFPEEFNDLNSIKSPSEFAHAYDLGKISIAAMRQMKFTGDITVDRDNLRQSLENLDFHIRGLIKLYEHPFSAYSSSNPDSHEALDINNYCMTLLKNDSEITLAREYE